MKHVLVLGATGGIGCFVTKYLGETEEIIRTVYVRNPAKLDKDVAKGVNVLKGNVLDTEKLIEAMQGQDIVIAALSGDWLGQAKSIVAALQHSKVARIIWVTGLGIHQEVPGETGKILEYYANRYPEYIEAANAIEASGTPYTLVRAANLMNGDNTKYFIHREGEQLHADTVDRCAVARFIADMVDNETGINESLGVTN